MTWVNINEAIYPVGHVIITSTNESPANLYGGTWTCIHKVFKEYKGSITTTKGANASSAGCEIVRAGNTIRFRVYFVPNTSIADSTLTMGYLDFESAGIDGLGYSVFNYHAGNDASGGWAMTTVAHDTGAIQTEEAIAQTSGTLASGNTYYLDFTQSCYPSKMLDSACKEWYWKRTA